MELGTSAKMLSIVPLMPARDVRGRRGLGAQARAAADRGKPPALGFARRIHAISVRSSDVGFKHHNKKAMILGPRPSTRRRPNCSTTAKNPSPRPASLHTRGSHY